MAAPLQWVYAISTTRALHVAGNGFIGVPTVDKIGIKANIQFFTHDLHRFLRMACEILITYEIHITAMRGKRLVPVQECLDGELASPNGILHEFKTG